LRERAGEWAVLAEVSGKLEADDRRLRALSSSIRTGNIGAFSPRGHYEAVSRMGDVGITLFVRYVGETEPVDTPE
jgi:hypothetical protein